MITVQSTISCPLLIPSLLHCIKNRTYLTSFVRHPVGRQWHSERCTVHPLQTFVNLYLESPTVCAAQISLMENSGEQRDAQCVLHTACMIQGANGTDFWRTFVPVWRLHTGRKFVDLCWYAWSTHREQVMWKSTRKLNGVLLMWAIYKTGLLAMLLAILLEIVLV